MLKKYLGIWLLRDHWLLSASDLFDADWYRATYPDVASAGVDPIRHYLLKGAIENRAPSPSFDPGYYLRTYPDVARAGLNPLVHYLRTGRREGRSCSGYRPRAGGPVAYPTRERALISESGFFDETWYRAIYPDVAAAGEDPVTHYLEKGAQEGRSPSPRFDSEFYLTAYPDVAAAGINPLIHYLEIGKYEGLKIREWSPDTKIISESGFFDETWYRTTYPDVEAAGVDPVTHYVESGAQEGRAPSPRFDSEFYLTAYPDVAAAGVNPLIHYVKVGRHEGRKIRKWSPDTKIISESGLFDENWYRTTYPDVQESGIDPLEHYVQYGANSGYAPGPLFDPSDFLKRHPDIAALSRKPLTWFLQSGQNEQRYAQSVHSEPAEDRWGTCMPIPILHDTSSRPSIAVAVHVFYIDVFEEICTYLKNLPYHFNLLITTPIDAHVQAVAKIVEQSGLKATLFVKLCENRGRNFAPLLVEFSNLIQRHDLLLHLHTKKSLHNGAAAAEWRSHLYKSLLGSKYLTNSIIELFARGDLGVLYPATHSWLPYWAHHWLSNSHLIQAFYNRISLQYSRPLEYIDFPVGSMFWARPRALKPLFDAQWKYEDFPPELGQNDGTIAHVIERSIVTIARSQGYGFIEFDYQAGSLRHNWSRKNLYQYSRRTKQNLYRGIEAADVISFDIFDTLITRRVLTPDSLQKYTGWLIAQRVPGLDNYFNIRKHAEEVARRRKDFKEDVDLDEIYREFPSEEPWSPQNIAFAKQLEMECEGRAFHPREDIIDAAKYARSLGKRVIAVSDTYFTRTFVERLLQQFGIIDLFDDIYLSSVRGVRKDRGDMWDLLMISEKLQSKRLLHIGDNEQSDVQLPGDRRFNIFHVMSPVTLMVNAGFPIPAKRHWASDLALGPVAARFFNSPFLDSQRFRPLYLSTPEDLGYAVFGPLLLGFFSWLFTHPVLKSLSHLYFLSREGFFLHKLFLKLQKAASFTTPVASYLHASRRATITAAQALEFDPSQITFGSGFRGSIAELLKVRLGLVLPGEFELGKTDVLLPNDVDYVQEVLTILKPYIVEHGSRELNGLRQYCSENGMMDAEKIGLIDIGYSGSIQNALQTVLDKPLVGLYIATTEDVFRVEAAGGFAFGCFADGETFAGTACPVLRHCRILESFLTAPHGQVLRFELEHDRSKPIYKSEGHSQLVFHTLTEIFKGVDAYFDELIESYDPEVLLTSPDLEITQLPLSALVEHNIVLPPSLVDALYLEDDFCGNAELRAGDLAVDRRECLQTV